MPRFNPPTPTFSVAMPGVIESPCVRNCCLNDDDICLGCGRSLQEITSWSTSNNSGKQVILTASAERRELLRIRRNANN